MARQRPTRIPSTIDEFFRRDVHVSWHAGWRAVERFGLVANDNLPRVLLGMIRSTGEIVGGQRSGDFLIMAKERNSGRRVAFVVRDCGGTWHIVSSLSPEMARANFEADRS